MQRFESTVLFILIAPVGQLSMHLVQFPHESGVGNNEESTGRSVTAEPMNVKEPTEGLMSIEFLPIHPRLELEAMFLSRTGPVST